MKFLFQVQSMLVFHIIKCLVFSTSAELEYFMYSVPTLGFHILFKKKAEKVWSGIEFAVLSHRSPISSFTVDKHQTAFKTHTDHLLKATLSSEITSSQQHFRVPK